MIRKQLNKAVIIFKRRLVDLALNNSVAFRGLNFIRFLNFNRNQTKNDRYWQKLFTFCKSFENVRFLLAFALKVLKKILLPVGIKKRRIVC